MQSGRPHYVVFSAILFTFIITSDRLQWSSQHL
jgi:hypothetical protein